MGTKISTPSTPDIRQFPATQAGSLRRNDGSIVPIPEGMTPTITPMPTIPRKDPRTTGGGRGFPSPQNVPTMEEFGQTARLAPGVSLEEAYNNFLSGPLGGGGRGFPSPQNVPTMEEFGQTARLAPGVSLEEAYNNFLSGPLGGGGPTPKPLPPGYNPLGSPRPTLSLQPNLSTQSAQYLINPVRPPSFSGQKNIPTMEEFGQTARLAPGVSLEEAYNKAFGPLAIKSPDSIAGIMSGLSQVPTPPGFPPGGAGPRIPIQSGNLGGAMIPEQGPLGPGLVGGTAPSTGMPQPINQPPMGPGELINPIKNIAPIQTPTEVPQPMNPVTGNTSPIGGSQQDFDAYINSYVNNLINQRMKNLFGGIMSYFS